MKRIGQDSSLTTEARCLGCFRGFVIKPEKERQPVCGATYARNALIVKGNGCTRGFDGGANMGDN